MTELPPPPFPMSVSQAKAVIAEDNRRQFMEVLAGLSERGEIWTLTVSDGERQVMEGIKLAVDGTWTFA